MRIFLNFYFSFREENEVNFFVDKVSPLFNSCLKKVRSKEIQKFCQLE